jgi:hypothetical protein
LIVDTDVDGTASHACSLHDAVAAINLQNIVPGSTCGRGNGSDDTIQFAFNVTLVTFASGSGNNSALNVQRAMTIDGRAQVGSGRPTVTLQRNSDPANQIRLINASAPLTLRGIAVQGGFMPNGYGGGISATQLTLVDCVVAGNTVSADDLGTARGGGIHADSVSLFSSRVSGNLATGGSGGLNGRGGGIDADNVYLGHSTVSGNTAYFSTAYENYYEDGFGGGIFAGTLVAIGSTISGNTLAGAGFPTLSNGGGISATDVTLIDSTVSGNVTDGARDGAAIEAASLRLFFSTVTGNRASPAGSGSGAIHLGVYGSSSGGSASIIGSIIFGNETADIAADYSAIASGDHNVIGRVGPMVSVPLDTRACDPKLAPLGLNGGITRTHGLLAGSCAIDTAQTSTDPGGGFAPLTADQRGDGFSRSVGAAPDVGAIEKQNADDPDLVFADGFDP